MAESYEEMREKRLEENKKRMEELNLKSLSQALKTKSPKSSPGKPRTPRKPVELTAARRSSRTADKPKPDYNDAHPKYVHFLNRKIDMYDEMAVVVGKDMASGSFAGQFAEIGLDETTEGSNHVPLMNEDTEQANPKVSSSIGTSKRKRKNRQENVNDGEYQIVGEQLGKIAKALDKFSESKSERLYKAVMSMETEGFDDLFLLRVYEFLVKNDSEAESFIPKSMKHRKIWLEDFPQAQGN